MKYLGIFLVILLASQTTFCAGKKDYYEVLGVSRDASKAQIKSAFRKLSLKVVSASS